MAFKWFKKNKETKKENTPQTQEIPESTEAVQVEETTVEEEMFEEETIDQEDKPAEEPADILLQEAEEEEPTQPNSSSSEPLPSESSKSPYFFKRLKNRLFKTHKALTGGVDTIFAGKTKIDDDLLEELEELLITSDIGVQTSMNLIERLSKKSSKIKTADQLKKALKEEMIALLDTETTIDTETVALEKAKEKPHVIMVLGVNGVGKTTTIGKLAAKFSAEGKTVLIAAADTFRAAAIEQLEIWADRAGAQIVKHSENSDPAAVAYDSIEAAISRGIDIVLVDTAGRLHTKVNLMEELKKIKRTLSRKLPNAPHEILLVLDATTGQNAVSQAKIFNDAIGVTGIALTKLDGTAKGGVVISICSDLKIPLNYIGIGEAIEDLQDFDPVKFVNAVF
ncbi:MAG: signal recognition particle-docking protein FtsY [Desulfobacterales bacterium]|nr:signal recognition particle-docking protein FtsY [Desulfobacterales bacterium]